MAVIAVSKTAKKKLNLIKESAKRVNSRQKAAREAVNALTEKYSSDEKDREKIFSLTNDISLYASALETFGMIYSTSGKIMKRITWDICETTFNYSIVIVEQAFSNALSGNNSDFIKNIRFVKSLDVYVNDFFSKKSDDTFSKIMFKNNSSLTKNIKIAKVLNNYINDFFEYEQNVSSK